MFCQTCCWRIYFMLSREDIDALGEQRFVALIEEIVKLAVRPTHY